MASKDEKKATRAAKRGKRRETWSNLKQAFVLTRKTDKKLVPYMAGAGIGAAGVVFVVVWLVSGKPLIGIPVAVAAGVIAAMLIFSRRAQKSMFGQAEGQPGAAGWMLSQRLRGDWRLTQAVAGNAQLDAVHRLVGRPGIVLVGEGSPVRVRGLIASEKRNLSRIAGDTPIYDFTVGNGEDEIPLAKLNRKLLTLPSNLSKGEVSALETRLTALAGGGRMPLPQGPLPQGAKMRNMQRATRRTRG
ncbi:MAG TPA: DUF4191 domain-containing protein [Jatrophihabitans sp.]|jgi:hypothetical protein